MLSLREEDFIKIAACVSLEAAFAHVLFGARVELLPHCSPRGARSHGGLGPAITLRGGLERDRSSLALSVGGRQRQGNLHFDKQPNL